jgi:hypothetical protein
MKLGYPELYRYPTTRNSGFSLDMKNPALTFTRKAWHRAMNGLDDAVWKSTGLSFYFWPEQLYGHRRELCQSLYHSAVAECIEDLKKTPAFNPQALDNLHARYRRRQPVSTHILRALFTVREWERRYA